MSENLPETDQPARSGERIDPDFLAYDFFKSFTSLCMITLGGVLTLSESVFGRQFEPWHIVAVSVPVALSGLIALQCQTDLVQLAKGVKPRSPLVLKYGLRLTPALYGGGIGAFLFVLFSSYLGQAGR
ncbi:MAG: hypothetical protein V4659_08060 [Pseudomonadota bacterium]